MYNLDFAGWASAFIILIIGLFFWWIVRQEKKDLKEQNEREDRIRADRLKHRQVGRVVAPPMDGRFPPVKLPFHKPAIRGKPEMNRRSRDTVQSQAQQQSDDGFVNGLLFGAVIGSSLSSHGSHDTSSPLEVPFSGGGGEFGGGGASSSWSDSCSSSDSGSSSCDSGGGGSSD